MIRWIIKTAATILVGFIACAVILCCIGCDATPLDAKIGANDATHQYLNGIQQFEFELLIGNFNALNAGDTIYWCWTNCEMTNEEVEEQNTRFEESGIIPIFVDVCRDGSLYVATPYERAFDIAEELNALNTNSFSRAMFFVDSIAMTIYGRTVTVYDAGKDVLK